MYLVSEALAQVGYFGSICFVFLLISSIFFFILRVSAMAGFALVTISRILYPVKFRHVWLP